MECRDCGAENKTGAYFCTGCGRPMGFEQRVGSATESPPGIEEVPGPGLSAETPPAPDDVPSRKPTGRALCSMCMGSFPETVMAVVDGRTYCPDCTPVTAHRSEPPKTGSDPFGYRSAAEYVPGSPPPAAPAAPPAGRLRWLIGVGALAVVGGAIFWAVGIGSDRIDRMLGGVDDKRLDARLMISRYREGERLDYDVRMHMKMDVDGDSGILGGISMAGKMDLEVTGAMHVDVLSVSNEGEADLRIALSGFRAGGKVVVNGREMPVGGMGEAFSGINGSTLEMRVDPFGDPLDGPEGPDPAASIPGLDEVLGGRIAGVPHHELRVGDTWTRRQPLETVNGMRLPVGTVQVEFEVVGYKKVGGRDCLVIAMHGSEDGKGSAPMGGGGRMNMELATKGVIFFDYLGGRMLKMAMDMDVDVSVSSSAGSVSAKAHVEMDLDLR